MLYDRNIVLRYFEDSAYSGSERMKDCRTEAAVDRYWIEYGIGQFLKLPAELWVGVGVDYSGAPALGKASSCSVVRGVIMPIR